MRKEDRPVKKQLSALLLAVLALLGASSASAAVSLEPAGVFTFSAALTNPYTGGVSQKNLTYTTRCSIDVVCTKDHEHDLKLTKCAVTEVEVASAPGRPSQGVKPLDIEHTFSASDSAQSGKLTADVDISCTVPSSRYSNNRSYPFRISLPVQCGEETAKAVYTIPLSPTLIDDAGGPIPHYGYTMNDLLEKIQYNPDVVYKLGDYDNGGYVIWFIQAALSDLGYYDGEHTHNFGPKTKDAVVFFQRDENLPDTGECDAQTMIRLFRLYLGSTEVTYGSDYHAYTWTKALKLLGSLDLKHEASATLVDLRTDISMTVRLRDFSGNHLEAAPDVTADMRALCRIYDAASPEEIPANAPRPMLLIIRHKGKNIQLVCSAGAALDGMHLSENNPRFNGHLCLYFSDSKTNGTNQATVTSDLYQRVFLEADSLMRGKTAGNAGLGDVVSGEGKLEEMPPVETPTLVFPDNTTLDASSLLKYSKSKKTNGTITYNVHMSDLNGDEIGLPEKSTLCTLCFPYPEGLDQNSARKYRIIIHHQISDKEAEVFKSEDGEIDFTPQGLCIRIKSFSPFEISWGVSGDALPGTGDSASLLPWLALLGACAASALALGRKKRRA